MFWILRCIREQWEQANHIATMAELEAESRRHQARMQWEREQRRFSTEGGAP